MTKKKSLRRVQKFGSAAVALITQKAKQVEAIAWKLTFKFI